MRTASDSGFLVPLRSGEYAVSALGPHIRKTQEKARVIFVRTFDWEEAALFYNQTDNSILNSETVLHLKDDSLPAATGWYDFCSGKSYNEDEVYFSPEKDLTDKKNVIN